MALPASQCFPGLDLRDQITAIYEALLELSDITDPVTPECFKGEDLLDQIEDLYAAVLGIPGSGSDDLPTPECIRWLDRSEQLRFIYEALFNIAGDESLLDPDCFLSYDLRYQVSYIYEALRVISDDGDLPSRECFLAGDWDQMIAGIFDALIDTSVGPVTVQMDLVVNFDSGSGTLTAAKMNAGSHGTFPGTWQEFHNGVLSNNTHSNIVDHAITLPFKLEVEGVLYDGSEGQGMEFDIDAASGVYDAWRRQVSGVGGTGIVMYLFKPEDTLNGGTPTDYNNDTHVIYSNDGGGTNYTVAQSRHNSNTSRSFIAHSEGNTGLNFLVNGEWLLVTILHTPGAGYFFVQEVLDNGGIGELGAILGASLTAHSPSPTEISQFLLQDYLLQNGGGVIKVKLLAYNMSDPVYPPYDPGTIPNNASLSAAQSAVNEAQIIWTGNFQEVNLDRSTNGGAYVNLLSNYGGLPNYADTTVEAPNTYTYRLRSVIGTKISSGITDSVTIDNGTDPGNGSLNWRFNNNLLDSSGNGLTGTVSGTTAYQVGQDGLPNHAFAFDGATSVQRAGFGNFTNQNFSISAWVFIQGGFLAQNPLLITCGNFQTSGWFVGFQADGTCFLASHQAGANQDVTTSSGAMTEDGWHHVVFVRNGNTGKIYVDTVDLTLGTPIIANPGAGAEPFNLGSYRNSSNYITGSVDDMRVYNGTVLTPSNINFLFLNGAQ